MNLDRDWRESKREEERLRKKKKIPKPTISQIDKEK